jgi:hypothetical protein
MFLGELPSWRITSRNIAAASITGAELSAASIQKHHLSPELRKELGLD